MANRLRRQMEGLGSTLFVLRWKWQVTPLGRRICQLAASVRRTSDSDCGSWPTPDVCAGGPASLELVERRAAEGKKPQLRLSAVANMASWPTPMAGTPAQKGYNEAGNTDSSRKTVELCSWPPPKASGRDESLENWNRRKETEYEKYPGKGLGSGSLEIIAQMAKNASATGRRPDGSKATVSLNQVATLAHGAISNGSNAQTEKRGQLSPAFSLWLMLENFATAWLSCAPQETRLYRKPRPLSSAGPL
jgi:hypothetical protein